jgi:hypothetical protein
MRSIIGVGLLACLLAVPVVYTRAQQKNGAVRVSEGFSSGKDFLGWTEQSRSDYGIGFVNGISVAHIVTGADLDKVRWLTPCVKDFDGEQIGAIIRKYIQDHPADWQNRLNILSWLALKETCMVNRP